MTTHAQREEALARIRQERDREQQYEPAHFAVWLGIVVIAAVIGYGVWQRFGPPPYDQAAHDAIKACRDRGERPVIYHAGDGRVLGVSCNRWAR